MTARSSRFTIRGSPSYAGTGDSAYAPAPGLLVWPGHGPEAFDAQPFLDLLAAPKPEGYGSPWGIREQPLPQQG